MTQPLSQAGSPLLPLSRREFLRRSGLGCGSLALALEAARRGARMVRVHDVHETVQALQLQAAVEGAA